MKTMKALAWHGKGDIRCDTVPDPNIEDGRDAIIKVTACAICGSDLHLFDGIMPTMEKGDVLGHETMGEVVEVGSENNTLRVGDRVVVPLTVSRLLGGFAGGQAESLRVPFADVGPIKVPQGLSDERVLFLSDIFPTGYMAADFCDLKGGETVAIWGCGPVGQFAIKNAFLLGAERVIAIDTVPERLALAEASGAITLDFRKEDIYDRLQEMTHGRGADACIDAVGTEPDTRSGFDAVVDRVKVATFMGTDRLHVLRQAMHCCRNFGRSQSLVFMAASLTRYQWAQPSIAASHPVWRKHQCSIICRSCSSVLKPEKSILRSSSPTARRWKKAPNSTKPFATRKTAASRWS
jgi:threonine dehydrogenase-like Zn-dependent dehydrogenase